MISVRGSSPKMASETVTEPDVLPSSEVTFSSISRALVRFGDGRLIRLCRGRRGRRALGELELAGLRHAVRQPLLHGVTHRDPATLNAGHCAFDQNEASLNIRLHHLEVERGDALDAQMAGHLFVLEGLAGILPAAGRTDRTMRYGDTM